MGVGVWLVMGVFWLLLLAVIVWLVVALATGRHNGVRRAAMAPGQPWRGPVGPGPAGPPMGRPMGAYGYAESPFEILDRRLATGEIDVPTYQQLRAALLESRGGPQ
jgi:putative membrane protein